MGWVFYSNLFPHVAPEGKVAFLGQIGGSLDPQALNLEDSHIRHLMMGELGLCLGQKRVPKPELFRVVRWRNSLPQPNVGHRRRIAAVQKMLSTEVPGLALAARWMGSNNINSRIRRGKEAAAQILGAPPLEPKAEVAP